MKYLFTQKFQERIQTLSSADKAVITSFVHSLKNLADQDLLNTLAPNVRENDISNYKLGSFIIFFNFTRDAQKELVLVFLDLTQEVARLNNRRNPNYNHDIHPTYNHNINPRYNPAFKGYYSYDRQLVALEYVIDIGNDVLLFYDFANTLVKYAFAHSQKGYVVYDNKMRHVGHLESDNQGGYTLFDKSSSWIGSIN